MGGSEATQEVQETELSKEATKVLEQREALYQSFILPELKDYYNDARDFQLNDEFLELNPQEASDVTGSAFEAQKSQLADTFKRRGLTGDEADAALGQFDATQSLAQGRAFNQSLVQSILQHNTNIQSRNENRFNVAQVRQGGIGALLSQSPGSTGAAPVFFYQRPRETGGIATAAQGIMGAAGALSSLSNLGGGGFSAGAASGEIGGAAASTGGASAAGSLPSAPSGLASAG